MADNVVAFPQPTETCFGCSSEAAAEHLRKMFADIPVLVASESADTVAKLSIGLPTLIPDNHPDSVAQMHRIAVTLSRLGTVARVANVKNTPRGWSVTDLATREEFAQLPLQQLDPPNTEKRVKGPKIPSATEDARNRWRELGLYVERGWPIPNIDNALKALTASAIPVWYDEFLQRAIIEWRCERREFRDTDYTDLTVWMQRDLEIRNMSLRVVTAACDAYIRQNVRNCAQDWVRQLEWDQTPRLDALGVDGFGTPDDAYHRAVLRCFLMAMVKRILEPGCQVDNMPVFEGPEGIRKSSALRILGGNWFAECHEEITGKDFLQIMPGKALLEISELYSFRRAEIERIKGIITNRVDRYRQSYGRIAGDHPRMCVFAGTTNRDDWNASDTGARRFWPVSCGIIDLDWIKANREQLFAEAAHRVQVGEPHWDVPATDARDAVDARRAADPWENAIRAYAEQRSDVSVDEILQHCLGFELSRVDQGAAGRVRSCLRLIGWVSRVTKRHGSSVRLWRPGGYASERTAAIEAEQAPPRKSAPSEPEQIPFTDDDVFDPAVPF